LTCSNLRVLSRDELLQTSYTPIPLRELGEALDFFEQVMIPTTQKGANAIESGNKDINVLTVATLDCVSICKAFASLWQKGVGFCLLDTDGPDPMATIHPDADTLAILLAAVNKFSVDVIAFDASLVIPSEWDNVIRALEMTSKSNLLA
jgi:hypothetical protein